MKKEKAYLSYGETIIVIILTLVIGFIFGVFFLHQVCPAYALLSSRYGAGFDPGVLFHAARRRNGDSFLCAGVSSDQLPPLLFRYR